nr:hypothetical protein [Tanacetum cinerariifolium]
MHILNDPSFFLTNKTVAPQGEELGLMKPFRKAIVIALIIPSYRMEPIDMVLELRGRLLELSRSGIPLVKLEEDPASPWERLQVPLEMLCSSTFETSISLRIFPIVPLSIPNVCVAKTSAVAGKVPYSVILVALLGTRVIVMKMALGALGQIPTVRLPLACPHIVDPGDVLPFGGLLSVTMV